MRELVLGPQVASAVLPELAVWLDQSDPVVVELWARRSLGAETLTEFCERVADAARRGAPLASEVWHAVRYA